MTRTFPTSRPRSVSLRVTDDDGVRSTITTKTVPVQPLAAPTLDFSVSPVPVLVNKPATFTAKLAPAPGRTVKSIQWLFGEDNTVDATGKTVSWTFRSAGAIKLRLRVTDDDNQVSELTDTVTVNSAPRVAFVASPADPLVGQQMTFVSYSEDNSGPLKSQAWDLDGDGQFDDASGPVASRSFSTAGPHRVGLRVTDQLGTAAALVQTITVKPKPVVSPAPPAPPVDTGPSFIQPPPTVRLSGAATRRGVRVFVLGVRAPKGVRITAVCRSRACPKKKTSSKVAGKRPVRFRKLERFFPAGASLEVKVRADGRIGKYTKFRIRGNKRAPSRTERCLWPGKRKPVQCPVP